MTKRHADVDLTEESDSETQEYVSDTEEDPAGEDPDQWRVRMALTIIGACRLCVWQDGPAFPSQLSRLYVYGEDHLAAVIQWGKPIIYKDYLKLLLRRDDVIPEDHMLQLQQW